MKISALIIFLFSFSGNFVFSQSDSTDKKNFIAKEIQDSSYSTTEPSEWQFEFKHLDKYYTYSVSKIADDAVIPYYFDKKKLDQIDELQKSGDLEELQKHLEEYIANFSYMNLSEDTYLLWELAQLYDGQGLTDKAMPLYRLILKHHNRGEVSLIQEFFANVNQPNEKGKRTKNTLPFQTQKTKVEMALEQQKFMKIKQHYDTATVNDRDYYVPLEYYYELVEFRKAIDTLRPPKSVLVNMGQDVNKKNIRDYAPTLNPDNTVIVYTKSFIDNKTVHGNMDPVSGKSTVHINEDLVFATGEDNFWSPFQRFDSPINSQCNEGSACISKSGKTMYFSRCEVKRYYMDCRDCIGSCDIYVTHLEDDSTWSQPKNLGPNVNTKAWDSQPTLSLSEDTLYFVSNRHGGFGSTDIYYSVKTGEDSWSKAINMGPIINTRYQEMSPFIHPKYKVLYFSSNGHLFNFADIDLEHKVAVSHDIYRTWMVDGKWQEPRNIGPLVNGVGIEQYFTIDSQSKFLYYAKTEEGKERIDPGITDLFSFPLPMEAQPLATIKLRGTLVDGETGNPLDAIVSVIDLQNGIEVAPKKVRGDGTFEFDLIDDKDYLLVIQGDDFFRIEKLFHLDGDTTINSEAEMIRNKKLKFTSIEFENGKANILPEMEEDLKKVIDFLIDNPKFDMTISGHTDHDGDHDANKRLSQRRADAIKLYLEENGYIESDRITAIGYGDTKPIIENEVTDEDKKINRRVEFEIFYSERKQEYSDEDFMDDSEPYDPENDTGDDDSGW